MTVNNEEQSIDFTGHIHASCVAINGHGVLLRGPSGSGKSDLALRLIDRGAILVSDDYTAVRRVGDHVMASVAPNITGQIEVRGVGIVRLPYLAEAPAELIVRLTDGDETGPDRYPLEEATERLCGIGLPALRLRPFEASVPLKIELRLRQIYDFLWPAGTA